MNIFCYLFIKLLIFIVLFFYQCDAVTEMTAVHLASYDGLSCQQTDVLFVLTNSRSRIECVNRCFELSVCACVFYKQGFCQGCHGLCHRGHHVALLPTLARTMYYYKRPAGISSLEGVISYGDHYYLINEFASSWLDAQKHCHNLQLTLVYIETQAELNWIASQLGAFHYWSGGILSDGQYVWSHSGAPIDMTLFGPGQPDNNGLCVGFLSSSHLLDDYICAVKEGFICKSI